MKIHLTQKYYVDVEGNGNRIPLKFAACRADIKYPLTPIEEAITCKRCKRIIAKAKEEM